jgi:hypothetical protein
MVIHLWGKFWMAAWRGKRTLTWVTGVIAFVTSIGTAFTGYLSQSNFDSQWIGAEGKDIQAFILEKYSDLVATKNKGMIMKSIMADLKGKADGKLINQVVGKLC